MQRRIIASRGASPIANRAKSSTSPAVEYRDVSRSDRPISCSGTERTSRRPCTAWTVRFDSSGDIIMFVSRVERPADLTGTEPYRVDTVDLFYKHGIFRGATPLTCTRAQSRAD